MISLQAIRNTASKVLATALLELYPDASFLKAEATALDFYCHFIFPYPITEEHLVFIEEKMREVIKRDLILEKKEMEKNNASLFLSHSNQLFRAEEVKKSSKPLVPILKMGSFVDIAPSLLCSRTSEIKAFKLQKVSCLGEVTHIHGVIERDPASLKRWIKELEKKKEKDHVRLGEVLDLFFLSEEGVYWRPRGEKVLSLLHHFWRDHVEKKGYEVIATPSQFSSISTRHLHYHSIYKSPALAEWGIAGQIREKNEPAGLLSVPFFMHDRLTLFCKEGEIAEKIRSSLQFIEEILRIFDFKYRVILRFKAGKRDKKKVDLLTHSCYFDMRLEREEEIDTPRVEFEIADIYERWWANPFVAIEGDGDSFRVISSIFGSIEGWIALLLERTEGDLPFMIAPEQMRVIVLGEQKKKSAYLADFFKEKGLRVSFDLEQLRLEEKIYRAALFKVPFIGIFGNREALHNQLCFRRWKEREEHLVSIEKVTREYLEGLTVENQ